MSSSIDDMTCPNCGGNAQSETNHKNGEVHNYCHNCDYEEIVTAGEEEKRYKLVNNTDGNNQIEIEGDTEEEAMAEVLDALGWSLVVY